MNRTTPRQYADALRQSLKGLAPAEAKNRIRAFLALVERRGDRRLLPRIVQEVMRRERRGALRVWSARPLSSVTKKALLLAFPERALEEAVEPQLIGGLVMSWDDIRIDATVRRRLGELREQLAHFGKPADNHVCAPTPIRS